MGALVSLGVGRLKDNCGDRFPQAGWGGGS